MRFKIMGWQLAPTALLALCALSVQAQTVRLTMSHFLGPQSFFQVDLLEPWARELERKTGGRVQVDVLNASSPLGNVRKQASQVKDGVVDIALGLRGAEGDRFSRSSIVELPFVVTDAGSGSKALWKLFQDGVIADEYRDFKVLALFVHNPGLIHTKATLVTELADLKGLRLRVPNATVAAALKHVGAVPKLLQPDEIIPALRTNQLDGIVTNWGTPIAGFNDEMTRHTAVPFYASAFFIVMNKARYESLPSDIRRAVDELSGDALVAQFGPLWNKWDQPFQQGAQAPGRVVLRPDTALLQRWRSGLQPVSDAHLAKLESLGFKSARQVYEQLLTPSGGG
ncbi:TRAP transporter substrate-binding protein [Achromobacter seleniivolatilans]|uniref:TRAP transporter substrate-binding protein n=1 Tax=Achromobacter seleniivolatilans TaxID=3047478 RepID=A0ABY9M7G8_9BURK|nr:TRAP transporter substrate-binding protein [Achromobacter sp. R39]WMD22931.1 TRAP transporter substrate-binding protein [Achromobacter sp. R39]